MHTKIFTKLLLSLSIGLLIVALNSVDLKAQTASKKETKQTNTIDLEVLKKKLENKTFQKWTPKELEAIYLKKITDPKMTEAQKEKARIALKNLKN